MSELADRIRTILADDPNCGEIRMFGGVCFTLNGNMLVGAMREDGLLVRVGEAQEADALSRPGATRMAFTNREMMGFVVVDPATLDQDALRSWIAMATAYVGAMPPKAGKSPTRNDVE
ncbi:TfoX/Sxy family protein [Mesorhizobium xinjiangense]|uniref:TfoX/Sxy family protein n=1 Tax=Mesorhizobium xinjiangense TaxID=2678685 RepID=UPI0018DB1046|nr:TfoX/Sxy family protein [Mesorhizobium xinjiangense]